MGGSMGANKNETSQSGSMNQDVWNKDAMNQLYGDARNFFNSQGNLYGQAQQADPYMHQAAQGGMSGYNDQLGGGAFGNTDDVRSKLLSSMGQPSQTGQMYNSIVGGAGNTYIDPMVDAMKQGAMENNAMMQSGNGQSAASMGQGGSSRHAMQNAMTNRSTNQDMMNQETAMRGGAYDKDLGMKMGIANMADSNRQQEQDRMMGMLQGANQSQQFGMGQGQNTQNMGMGTMAPWMQAQGNQQNAFNNYANTIGGPAVLTNGTMSGGSESKGHGTQGGFWG